MLSFFYKQVRRESNILADELANQARTKSQKYVI